MPFELPPLAILPVNKLRLHERHDNQRTPPLVARLESSGVLRDPPIVTPIDGTDEYLVLDGANRTQAFRQMNCPHILAQVIPAEDSSLELKTWNHVIWGMEEEALLKQIERLPEIRLSPDQSPRMEPDFAGSPTLAILQTPKRGSFKVLSGSSEPLQKIALLNQVVNSYIHAAQMDRTALCDVIPVCHLYPELCALLIMPQFSLSEVMSYTRSGALLPSGVTRFVVSPRVLRVNYPLSELKAEKSLDEKNATLTRWLQERLTQKSVRLYAEATILFDE
jgi:hypothetical protein